MEDGKSAHSKPPAITRDDSSENSAMNFLSAVVDSMPMAIFCKDASDDFRFIVWNKRQEEVTGIAQENALGKTDYDIFSTEAANRFREIDEHVVRSGTTMDIPEEEVHTAKWGRIWLHTVKVAVASSDGQPSILLGISEDITERKRAREQLHQLNENLSRTSAELKETQLQLIQAEKMESVGRLAAGVAHEVKNPLALLLMGVEYLDSGFESGDPNLPIILKEMREAISRAERIIHGLVDFSSQRQLDLQPKEIRPLIEQALLLVRHEVTRASVRVETEFEPDLPPVLLDSAKFEQVMVNILINAIHAFEKEEQPTIWIRVRHDRVSSVLSDEGARGAERLHEGEEVVRIEIRDNGPGISPEKLDKVFDPFFTTKPAGAGTGLGLSVVRKIIELHHGSITIDNHPENGVIVTILLRSQPWLTEGG